MNFFLSVHECEIFLDESQIFFIHHRIVRQQHI